MTTTETLVVVAGAAWLGLVTLAVILCISQLTVLTRRLELVIGPLSPSESGPAIGMPLPDAAEELLLDDPRGELVLLMSATCGPCRTVADELSRNGYEGPLTVLLPGDAELADEVAALLPASVGVVRDPYATEHANTLQITHTPFALGVRNRTVVGKTPVNHLGDLLRLEQAVSEIDAGSLPLVETGGKP